MPISPIGTVPVPPGVNRAFSNIQPFTYPDGATFLTLLESMRDYMENTLVPFIQEGLDEYAAEVIAVLNALVVEAKQARDGAVEAAENAQISAESARQAEIACEAILAEMRRILPNMANYVTNAELVEILDGYVTDAELQSMIADIIADDETIRQAAVEAVTDAAAGMDLMVSTHGYIDHAVNINEYRNKADIGTYVIRTENALGGPILPGTSRLAVFEVLWGASNGVLQRFTTTDGAWYRHAMDGSGNWYPWHQFMRDGDGVPMARGELTIGTDLNILRRKDHAGVWDLLGNANGDYPNAPDTSSQRAVLVVEVGNEYAAVIQHVYYSAIDRPLEHWARKLTRIDEGTGLEVWYPWREMSEQSTRGTLSDGTDLNTLYQKQHAGSWHMQGRANATYPNAPGSSTQATELVVNVANELNAIVQHWYVAASDRLLEHWMRKIQVVSADGNATWYPWHRMARADELGSGSGSGSGISYDDDGVPYIAEGAGDNPQPAERRLVTEARVLDVMPESTVESGAVRRIIVSNDASTPLQNGDLLFVYGS